MIKGYVILIFILLLIVNSFSQNFADFKTYGNEAAETSFGIANSFSEGFLIPLHRNYPTKEWNELWLINTDIHGDTLWTKSYTYNNNFWEIFVPSFITQTNDTLSQVLNLV